MRDQTLDCRRRAQVAKRREARLQRFAPLYRDRIAALTCCAPEAEDLIESFPALLIALVSDFGTTNARAKAFETVLSGGSLKAAANALRLPMWLRKVPPEAFRQPLQQVPDEGQFAARIMNFVPAESGSAGDWLEQVSAANQTCDSSFALWVAKHCNAIAASRRNAVFLAMAGWAWHATRTETVGHRLIEQPWQAKMGLRRATEELMRWRRRTDLACLLGDGISRPWLESGTHAGFSFEPLLTIDDFIEESRAMHNCLDQYADRLATGLIRVFSIRQGSTRVADIEVGPVTETHAIPSIVQIKGPHNRQAPLAVWQAAQTWLEAQPLDRLPPRAGSVREPDRDIPAFWQPYYTWLPEARRADFERYVLMRQRTLAGRSPAVAPSAELPHPVERAARRRRLARDTG